MSLLEAFRKEMSDADNGKVASLKRLGCEICDAM
jgi:hypothetical protein